MNNQTKKYSFNQICLLFQILIAICIGGCVNQAGVKMGSPSDEIVKSVAVAFIKSNQGDPHSFGGWFVGTSPAHWQYMSNAFIRHVPPVKYADQCIKYPDKVVDRDSKKVGVLVSINEPSFIDDTHAEVSVVCFEGSGSGSSSFANFVYKMLKSKNGWVVQSVQV